MVRSCCSLKRCLKDPITNTDPENAQAAYDGYQSLLGNIIMMGTLLLGFTVTGTMLSLTLSGEDNFDVTEIIYFLLTSYTAAIAAGISTILAFLISIRGTQAAANQGSVRALKVMRHSVCGVGGSEWMLYVSLIFFVISLYKYVRMQYTGPLICPTDMDSTSVYRPSAFCSLLGGDLAGAAQEKNNSADMMDQYLYIQSQLQTTGETRREDGMLFFGWSLGFVDVTATVARYGAFEDAALEALGAEDKKPWSELRFHVVDVLANTFCKKAQMEALMNEACAAGASPALSETCASAMTAFKLADDCVGAKTDDAIKCYKVCPQNPNIDMFFFEGRTDMSFTPRTNRLGEIMRIIQKSMVACVVLLILISVVRCFTVIRHVASSHHHSNVTFLRATLGEATGVLQDTPYSDDEAELKRGA